MFVLGSVASYGATIFLLPPSLVLLARLVPLAAISAAPVDTAPGAVLYLPIA
jgi:hypothetical protein